MAIDLEQFTHKPTHQRDRTFFDENPIVEMLRQYCLTELLPYDLWANRGTSLKTDLEQYQMILSSAVEAINSLIQGDLIKFDSFVGENACQVRAIWIALIASKNQKKHIQAREKIAEIEKKIYLILQTTQDSELNAKYETFDCILKSEHLSTEVSFEIYLIIQLFLLAEAKISPHCTNLLTSLCNPAKSDPKKLKRFGNVSSTFLEKIVRKYRKFVAKASVQFVRDQAKKKHDDHLERMLSEQFSIEHNNHLICTPMFWTYKSVLFTACVERIPIIVHAKFLIKEADSYRIIDEDWLMYQTDTSAPEISRLVHRNVNEVDANKAALVIQGIVLVKQELAHSKAKWRKAMLSYPISTAILAGTADHPQYPNSTQCILNCLHQDHEYEAYKSIAKSDGFTLNNPTTFFIQHVYSSQVNRVISAQN